MGGDVIELEAGLPVSAPLPSRGRIHAGRLPGGEAAVTTHVGSYDGLITAGEVLSAWVEKQGRNASGPNWEVYVTDPGREPDPARWRTDVYQPLV
jgi:effector-binding domain-containing protein